MGKLSNGGCLELNALPVFGLYPRGLRHLIQCLALGLAEGIAQFFRKVFRAKFKVFPVGRAQGIILLEDSQAFVDFGAGVWVAFIHHSLMGIGPCFPLIADLGIPVFHMLKELFCHGRADRGADDVIEAIFTKHQCDAPALEKYFCKSGTVFAGKTSTAYGFNFADTVMRVMDAIALGNSDKFSPLG